VVGERRGATAERARSVAHRKTCQRKRGRIPYEIQYGIHMGPMVLNIGPQPGPSAKMRAVSRPPQRALAQARIVALGPGLDPIWDSI